ncbi:hypothetical protein SAMN05660420_00077 [Desulfuromusa kysingii]|uniref:Probable membrane transporter protein n=1 Tax=Desulfuromusa kysingii TaxID=37625 RepID=A0A1H3VI78_9BACT|nr:TSUP family transporter [Desulfuromusa kysingii]SDZ74470.1 hypothetical protein SAMN05660420_00077 [Desulfuromusa kysingii]
MEIVLTEQITFLGIFAVGLVAGSVDAIAGGGGLLTLPALLATGIPPINAIATAKLQSTAGTCSAAICYFRNGTFDLKPLLLALPCTLIGSISGVICLNYINPQFIHGLLPLLFIVVGGYFLLSPQVGDLDRRQRITPNMFAVLIGTSIGFYDGFLGPGTGTFLMAGFISLLGYNLRRATAATKVLNLTSNVAALALFICAGQVLWSYGLVMAAGQIIGGNIGARLAIGRGTGLIRPLVVSICLVMILKVWGVEMFHLLT